MSSARFALSLKPDRRLRRALLAAAACALLAGAAIVLHLPLSAWLRALLLALWIGVSAAEIAAMALAAARVRRIEVDADGRLHGRGRDGRRFELQLLAGSVVGARTAWLRLRLPGGPRYGECLRGDPDDADWRRLQVHWRQARLGRG